MDQQLTDIQRETESKISNFTQLSDLESLRVTVLGKKGSLTQLLKSIGQLPADQRPEMGQRINAVKAAIQTAIQTKISALEDAALQDKLVQEKVDITMPGEDIAIGTAHPIQTVMNDIQDLFGRLGFSVAEGPEIETDYYNFEALNIPKNHPARDMHDTFYLTDGKVLRTHTSPVQIHVMENQPPPIKIIIPGRVYRCDADVSHSPVFHQIEGLYVERNVNFAQLKGTLSYFIKAMFGEKTGVRFRPSFFPFTEPSAEVDMACAVCEGSGCGVCKHTGWVEILGAGMVHRNVFRSVGIDPDEYAGFAFGLGIERIAMLRYQITNIRHFYENDQRFLNQF